MARWEDTRVPIGVGKVVVELPVSDGTTATEILNWTMDESGVLDSTWRMMPFIPYEWQSPAAQPEPFSRGVRGLLSTTILGCPELLIIADYDDGDTDGVVYRYTPWDRAAGGDHPGLARQFQYQGVTRSILNSTPNPRVPPCMVAANDRVYFTLGDGSGVWVWDTVEVRAAGMPIIPGAPQVDGPARNGGNPNSGGFSVRGRLGQTEASWTNADNEIVGGMDEYVRRYAQVYVGPDGAYSAMSPLGGAIQINLEMANPDPTNPDENPVYVDGLLRRVRVLIGEAPVGVTERIILATPNLKRIPPGLTGAPQYHSRIEDGTTEEFIDDIPDGELGAVWQDREPFPTNVYGIQNFQGSNWYFDDNCRVWWTEQTAEGPIYESVLKGHWKDVYPTTGRTMAAFPIRLRTQQGEAPAMLVLKPAAAHFVSGDYPSWRFGTLHPKAGCGGWRLVQSLPDGATMWAGNGTFWRLGEDGGIDDVGKSIRKRLRRVNWSKAMFGDSWLNRAKGEAVFVLPMDDSVVANYQFRWDYRLGGWRFGQDVEVTAACNHGDLVLLAGGYDAIKNLWVYGRGYPSRDQSGDPTPPTAVFSTGWVQLGKPNSPMGMSSSTQSAVLLLEERCNQRAALSVFKNWNADTALTTMSVDLYTPTGEDVPCFDTATYSSSVWRDRRTYAHDVPITQDRGMVFMLRLETNSPMAISTIDLYGPVVAPPGADTPRHQ